MSHLIPISQYKIPIHHYDTLIIGSGAAGFSAAERLHDLDCKNIALITEHVLAGTSRNTGSDKQTYYKLTLSGSRPDSVRAMAETLISGGCVDGDLALCEAALSARCFYHLAESGVPFPCDRYGEYVGYKTDHDPFARATSAGPYTSKMMTEVLEASVKKKGIPIIDHMQVVRILTDQDCEGGCARGVLCLNLAHEDRYTGGSLRSIPDNEGGEETSPFVVYTCKNLILATGGPAGIYYDSVYPHGHHGSTGLAFEAGASGQNLTEWQYGLASLHPRWNASGTYMQVLPRFVSTTQDGFDEREFLSDYFKDSRELLNKIFLKGYQWPFDVRKIRDGSSIIDILVYLETQKGRRVYLDYTKNPCGGIDFDRLPDEPRVYLKKAHACFGTPYERLIQMNEPAAAFYLDKGIDLSRKPLEIALCAQHNNGGLAVDAWWQTSIRGLFCIGEACGSHGIYRPGGTALNAGQVGALRAAQFIAASGCVVPRSDASGFCSTVHDTTDPEPSEPPISNAAALISQIAEILQMSEQVMDGGEENISSLTEDFQKQMSLAGAAFRDLKKMKELLERVNRSLPSLPELCHAKCLRQLRNFFLLRDILLCQQAYLSAMIDHAEKGQDSHGSAIYLEKNGEPIHPCLPDTFRFFEDPKDSQHMIQVVSCRDGNTSIRWRAPRPIPEDDSFFENVWRQFRANKNIY